MKIHLDTRDASPTVKHCLIELATTVGDILANLPSTATAAECYSALTGVDVTILPEDYRVTQVCRYLLLRFAPCLSEWNGVIARGGLSGPHSVLTRIKLPAGAYKHEEQSKALKGVLAWLVEKGKAFPEFARGYELGKRIEMLQATALASRQPIVDLSSLATEESLRSVPFTKADVDQHAGILEETENARTLFTEQELEVVPGCSNIQLDEGERKSMFLLGLLLQTPIDLFDGHLVDCWISLPWDLSQFFDGHADWAEHTSDTTKPPKLNPLELRFEQLIHKTEVSDQVKLHKAFWSLVHASVFDEFVELVLAVQGKSNHEQKEQFQVELADIASTGVDRDIDIYRLVIKYAKVVAKEELEAYYKAERLQWSNLRSLLSKQIIANAWQMYGEDGFGIIRVKQPPQ